MRNNDMLYETKTISDNVYQKIPEKLSELTNLFTSGREKDLVLLSSIVVISSLFDKYYVNYDRDILHSNLFLMIVAPPASSKGVIKHTRFISVPFDDMEIAKSQKSDDDSENKRKVRLHIIPGNISYAGVLELLRNNGNKGLIFETEADAINNVKKNEWGDYSSLLRKAFHHESERYFRTTESKYIDLKDIKFSMVLSGTIEQFINFFPSTENGLYSRFICYIYAENDEWKDVFNGSNSGIPLNKKFESFGKYILENLPDERIEFQFEKSQQELFPLKKSQQELFKEYFDSKYKTYSWLEEGNESVIRRMGIIATRIAMVLSMVRNIETVKSDKVLICSDDDFQSAMNIIDVLLNHTETALKIIPGDNQNIRFKSNKAQEFYLLLPLKFKREEILNQKNVPFSRSTFDRMLADKSNFESLGNGEYRKKDIKY